MIFLHCTFLNFLRINQRRNTHNFRIPRLILNPGKISFKNLMSPRRYFDAELADEMQWFECVAQVLEPVLHPEDCPPQDQTTLFYYVRCDVCLTVANFIASGADERKATDEFIASGWCYNRHRLGFDARCPDCRKKPAPAKLVKRRR